ncbi:MAG: hypothetical protein WDN24_06250 [Sphingomonas sp.]
MTDFVIGDEAAAALCARGLRGGDDAVALVVMLLGVRHYGGEITRPEKAGERRGGIGAAPEVH